MEMITVDSSNIAAVGYDDDTGTLYVEFNSGKTYSYSDVPEDVALGLIEAESVGSYFHAQIRTGGYEYAEI